MSNDGSVVFEPLSGRAGIWGQVSFPPLSALSDGDGTRDGAQGATVFAALTATGTTVPVITAVGAVVFSPLEGFGTTPRSGAVVFQEMVASGIGRGAAVGAVVFQPLGVRWVSGLVFFGPLQASGLATEGLGDVFDAKVMNTGLAAVTEFSNFKFNSFARIGDAYYGAGPAGLVRLEGVDDAGANINWVARTGQHDDKNIGLKRLPEVLLGLRSNGNIVVRVYKDDNEFHDYALPKVKTNTLHQHRVLPGKGMRAKHFSVELRGAQNADLELDSFQMNMSKTTRRLG